MIKQITDNDVETGGIVCHSYNPKFKDFEISLYEVYVLYYVKKVVDRAVKPKLKKRKII